MNVVHCHGYFSSPSDMFMILELCEPGDLQTLLNDVGCFGEEWGRWLIAEIAVSLSVFHDCGIIHNNLKPSNVLMGSDGHIKFTDLGISKFGNS